MAETKLKGTVVNLAGTQINVGDVAPIVNVAGADLADMQIGGQQGKTQILIVVPSLDTPVCAAETRKFNEEASSMQNVDAFVVSMDLPFAMGRFCTTEGIDAIKVGSDFREKELSKAYGVLLADGPLAGVTARAIFVINKAGIVTYKEITEDITDEPDYDAALKAVNDANN